MYYINQDEELNPLKIGQIINAFKTRELPRLERYRNYYLGNQDILRKTVNDDTKPNEKVVSNYMYEIVNTYAGYLTGKDITYTSDESIEEIQDILNYNDVSSEDALFLKNALIYGLAYECMWIDKDGKQRFRVLDSRQCIPVYYNNLEENLAAVIRFYVVSNLDLIESQYYVEVYSERETITYLSDNSFTSFQVLDYVPNFYSMVPITVFNLNDEKESIFDKVMTLQDAYNKLLSSEVDDFEAFVMAYLVLQGIDDVDPEQLHLMRTNRVLQLPEGATANFLTKNIADTQIQNLLDNVRDTIREVAACPNFNDQNFGTSSGVAIRYKLINFENRAGQIEKQMTLALQRRIELICGMATLSLGEDMWRDIQIIFTRNLPIDYQDLASMVNQLRGLVSQKTLVAQIPFVQDIDAEMELVQEEQEANAALYNFSSGKEEEEVDDELLKR